MADDALAHAVAALRECFEECGLWLGAAAPVSGPTLAAARKRLFAGATDMGTLSAEFGLPLVTTALAPWSHWVTPIDAAKRFDTRFFVALAPPGQEPAVDERETITLVWANPADALARHARDELALEFATLRTLKSLLPFDSAAALLEQARRPRELSTIVCRNCSGWPPGMAFSSIGHAMRSTACFDTGRHAKPRSSRRFAIWASPHSASSSAPSTTTCPCACMQPHNGPCSPT